MYNVLGDNGYFIAIGGQGKMFTLRKCNRLGEEWHIQNLAHTWEEAEAKAFERTGFHLPAPECTLNPLASHMTIEDAKMPYGKYKDCLVTDVVKEDLGYLVWWTNRAKEFYESDPNAKVKRLDKIIMEIPAVVEELTRRENAHKEREAKRQAENEALQASSKFIGTIDERLQFTGTIVFTKSFENAYGIGHMTKVHTDDGSEVMYWNIIGLDASDLGFTDHKLDGNVGDKVTFYAAVKDHSVYNGIKQTVVKRATRGKLIEAGKETANYINMFN